MAGQFHIGKNGEPTACKAQDGQCPLGGEHFSCKDEAARAAERINESHTQLEGLPISSEVAGKLGGVDITTASVDDLTKRGVAVEDAVTIVNAMRYSEGNRASLREDAVKALNDYRTARLNAMVAGSNLDNARSEYQYLLRDHMTRFEGFPPSKSATVAKEMASKIGQPFRNLKLLANEYDDAVGDALIRFDTFAPHLGDNVAKAYKECKNADEAYERTRVSAVIAQREIARLNRLDSGNEVESRMLRKMAERKLPPVGSIVKAKAQTPDWGNVRIERDHTIRNLYMETESGELVRVCSVDSDTREYVDENGGRHSYRLVQTGMDNYIHPTYNFVTLYDNGGEGNGYSLQPKSNYPSVQNEDGTWTDILGLQDRKRHWVNGEERKW